MTLPRVPRGTGEGVGPRAARGVLLSRQGELLFTRPQQSSYGITTVLLHIYQLVVHSLSWPCIGTEYHTLTVSWHSGSVVRAAVQHNINSDSGTATTTVDLLLHYHGAPLNASLMGTKTGRGRRLNRRSCSDRSVPVTFDATGVRVCRHASSKDGATF